VKLTPSTEPDLTKRPGCSSCHETLEPLAAYFSRVAESDWTYLPAAKFPVVSSQCAAAKGARIGGACSTFYDPAFTNADHALLRGAYASPSHADEGPQGLAREIVTSPEFARCVVKNVAQSFLGRPLAPEEAGWELGLAKAFVEDGYRMRPLVRAILTSPRYRFADQRSTESK
jgi:hypothetical protein